MPTCPDGQEHEVQPGFVCPRAAFKLLGLFLFPGPDLPKPAVISQLEQGAELWVAERGGSRACHPGKNPTKWMPQLGKFQVTGGALLERMMFQGPQNHPFLTRFTEVCIIVLTALIIAKDTEQNL